MSSNNFFHSPELYHILEKTSGYRPFMVVAEDEKGKVVAHLLAIIRRRGSLLPPYLFTQGRIYGEGEYDMEKGREEVFGRMLTLITQKFRRNFCTWAEFSNMGQKMFGYRHFRENGYFPVPWQEIHNSLHSMAPEERLTPKTASRIEKAYNMGVVTREVETLEELHAFYQMLHGFYRFKIRRFLPKEELIEEIDASDNGKVFITLYKNKVIGGCTCVYSGGKAFLLHLASKRKTYKALHPDTLTVWQAIRYAYEHNYAHIYFMDAGLPFQKNIFRDFILSFGGKPVSKYRWFRFSFPTVNKILNWFYRE